MTTFKDFARRALDFYRRHRLVINFVVLGFVYFLCCFAEGASYAALVFLLFFTFTEKNYGGVYYLIFSLPFVNVLVFATYGYVLPIVAVLFVLYAFVKIFIIERCKLNKVSLVFFILLEIYLALPLNPYSTMGFVKMAVFLLGFMFLEICREKCRLINFKTFVYAFIFGMLVSTLYSLLTPYSALLQSISVDYFYNDMRRFTGLLGHPNMFSIFSLIAVICSAYLIFNEKYRIFHSILFILVTIAGFLTFSKTFFLLFLLVAFFMVIKMFMLNPKKALIVCAGVLVVIGFSYLLFTDFVTSFFTRFFSATQFDEIKEFNWSEFLTFRNDLWGEYLTKIFEDTYNVFFGFGLGAGKLEGLLNPHNAYITTVYQTGIIGFFLIFFLLIYMLIQIYKSASTKKKVDWFMFVPLLVMLMVMFVEDFLF